MIKKLNTVPVHYAINFRLFLLLVAFFFITACSNSKKLVVQYIGQNYSATQNKSFVNNQLILLKGNDTIRMNVKLPFDTSTSDTLNNGILYRCFLKEKKTYTITLKPICPAAIPEVVNSYYRINTLPAGRKCSAFREVKKDTEFMQRNPGKYVDIDHRVYEIIGLWPDTDCAFE